VDRFGPDVAVEVDTTVLGQPYTSAFYLALAGLAAELRCQLMDLGQAGGADGVTTRQQAARWVDRKSPAQLRRPRPQQRPPSTRLREPQRLVGPSSNICAGTRLAAMVQPPTIGLCP
jgi:hypothetical protein